MKKLVLLLILFTAYVGSTAPIPSSLGFGPSAAPILSSLGFGPSVAWAQDDDDQGEDDDDQGEDNDDQ